MWALPAAAHRVHAVTLTGLGERAHLPSSAITLETHIADLAKTLEAEELDDVVLAVHSYAGMIAPALATIGPIRLRLADPSFWDGHWQRGGRVIERKTGDDPMVSAPQDLVRVLVDGIGP